MASPSSVLTRGLGSWGSASLMLTRGLGSAEVSEPGAMGAAVSHHPSAMAATRVRLTMGAAVRVTPSES